MMNDKVQEYAEGVTNVEYPMISDNGVLRQMTDEEYRHWTASRAQPAPVPVRVEMRQARLSLLHAGYFKTIDTYISNMEGDAGDEARINWNYARTVERSSPLVAAMQQLLSVPDAEIDELFIYAATLE